MTEASTNGSHLYGSTSISGQATVIQGNNHGTINVKNETYVCPSSVDAANGRYPVKIMRKNQVLHTHTLETITKFQDCGPANDRGNALSVEVRWERRERIGLGAYGEVHREENCERH